jgi:hypothetical protein
MLLGSLFCSKLLNFISCGPIEALPNLLFVVVVLISTILFSSCCCCLFFHGFYPVYITEHIPKYCSIESFIKLPFQRVLIYLNRSPNEGVMTVLFLLLHAVQKISEPATFGNSAISACRNLRLTWFLIRWKRNFMGLINIQIYHIVLPWGCADIDANRNFLWIDPNMLTILILWSSGRYIVSPLALSPHHCWTSE